MPIEKPKIQNNMVIDLGVELPGILPKPENSLICLLKKNAGNSSAAIGSKRNGNS